MSKQIQALKAEIILVLTDPDNILSHGARKSLCYVSQGLEALAADVPQVAFGNKAEQTAQRDPSQDGPDCEDGPDEEGFRGPRPWNGFDTTTPQPAREWVGLTPEESVALFERHGHRTGELVGAVEDKLKEKNGL